MSTGRRCEILYSAKYASQLVSQDVRWNNVDAPFASMRQPQRGRTPMATPTQSATKCALCGEPRIAGAKFCSLCGATFQSAPRAVAKQSTLRRVGQSTDLLYVLGAALIAVTLSHLPVVDMAIYPFKLFGTFVHEWCHALVAVATGGTVTRLQINTDLSGETFTSCRSSARATSAQRWSAPCCCLFLRDLPTACSSASAYSRC